MRKFGFVLPHAYLKERPDFGDKALRSPDELEINGVYVRYYCVPDTKKRRFLHKWEIIKIEGILPKDKILITWVGTLSKPHILDYETVGFKRFHAGWSHFNHLEKAEN